jgi:hypothetical protein
VVVTVVTAAVGSLVALPSASTSVVLVAVLLRFVKGPWLVVGIEASLSRIMAFSGYQQSSFFQPFTARRMRYCQAFG